MSRWRYAAGTGSRTVSIPAQAKVLMFDATGANGSITVDGGDSISTPNGLYMRPNGALVGPVDIVFTDCDSYVVAWVVDFE